jgi:hypothetical protein
MNKGSVRLPGGASATPFSTLSRHLNDRVGTLSSRFDSTPQPRRDARGCRLNLDSRKPRGRSKVTLAGREAVWDSRRTMIAVNDQTRHAVRTLMFRGA